MAPFQNHDPFGLLAFLSWNHDWNKWYFNRAVLLKSLEQIRKLGISFIRLDIVWSDVHRGFHKYDFSRYDELLSLLKEHNIQILGLLHYNKNRLDSDGKEIWNLPPESFDEFAAYVAATVDRYKTQIKYWEIWNEPNHPVYWVGPRDGLKRYSELLTLSYHAAKKADPSCVVLNGGITEPLYEDIENFYRNGGKKICDLLAIHIFVDPLHPDREKQFSGLVKHVEDIMAQHGDGGKKIWITELGCPGVPPGENAPTWFIGKSPNEEEQAEWLETVYGVLKKHPRVQKLFWAFYRDTQGIFPDSTNFFGLVRFDLTPKPSYERMRSLIRNHSNSGSKN